MRAFVEWKQNNKKPRDDTKSTNIVLSLLAIVAFRATLPSVHSGFVPDLPLLPQFFFYLGMLNVFLAATFILGFLFVYLQATEYHHAYTELGLTLGTGIYGSTFFMLTGFHGFHVTLGAIMLFCIWLRTLKGHFTPERHFAFEAVAWYWHFVDVVWLGLFIFVYWI